MAESVAGRVFSVLDAFVDAPVTLRLTEIARRTGLPVPTALRMVRELVAWGGLERGADGSYRLGTRIRTLGAAAPCPRGLLDTALPALRALTARTGGHADVVIPAGGTALCLVTGARLPPHATAAGKVLLAHGLLTAPAAAERHTPAPAPPRARSPPSWPASARAAWPRPTRSTTWANCPSRPRCSGPAPSWRPSP